MEVGIQLLVVKPGQQMVFPLTQRNGFGHLIINVDAPEIFIRGVGKAVKLIDFTARPGCINTALVGIDVKIARLLVKAPAAVKLMFKAVTQHPLALFKPAPFVAGIIPLARIFRTQPRAAAG